MLRPTRQALKDSQSPIPNIQPQVHMPFCGSHGLLEVNQVSSVPSSQPHGERELAGSENQEEGLEDIIRLSDYQKAVKEASKYMAWPYLMPTPNVGSMTEKFIEVLRKKQVFLTELADTEFACEDYETALRRYLGDAEVDRLLRAHFVIQKPQTVKGKYMAAVAGMTMRDFCLSREPLPQASPLL